MTDPNYAVILKRFSDYLLGKNKGKTKCSNKYNINTKAAQEFDKYGRQTARFMSIPREQIILDKLPNACLSIQYGFHLNSVLIEKSGME